MIVGGTALDPRRALLDRVGEHALVDVGDLRARVVVERELVPGWIVIPVSASVRPAAPRGLVVCARASRTTGAGPPRSPLPSAQPIAAPPPRAKIATTRRGTQRTCLRADATASSLSLGLGIGRRFDSAATDQTPGPLGSRA